MTSPTTTDPATVLHFWFEDLTSAQHFAKDAALDAAIAQRFGPTLEAAARGELSGWRASTPGRLAEIVVLDQFSRNVWRNTPRAFAQDGMALVLAQELVASGPGPVHTLFARCVAIKKGQAQGAKRSWGAAPARLGNAAHGPFWSQPEGNGMKPAPLVVALLAKAPALASSRA